MSRAESDVRLAALASRRDKEHTSDLNEPAAIAAVQAPEIMAKLTLSEHVTRKNRLSAPQLKAAAEAVQ